MWPTCRSGRRRSSAMDRGRAGMVFRRRGRRLRQAAVAAAFAALLVYSRGWQPQACWAQVSPRRGALLGLLGASSSLAVSLAEMSPALAEAPPQEVLLVAPYKPQVEKLQKIVRQTGELANMFSTQGSGGSLIGGSADALRERMGEGKKDVLEPLQRDLEAAAAKIIGVLSNADDKKRMEELPVELKGHLLELDEAVQKGFFSEYTSAKTGKTYTGGKAERELEEVVEVLDEFLTLSKRLKA
eukprot:TRINITY_DN9036_c0_g1_i1.p1 TRINITY_DN9036_c0_g1~~TRINITY_DN9036_c0_g1_i1.p1  ORF type:complete len:242 (-),score=82.19 TRINITY_DN9036_c0_g1_i1:87-812(-)